MISQLELERQSAMANKEMAQEMSHTSTLSEIVGVDVNSKAFKNFVTVDFKADNTMISNGGSVVIQPGGNSTITIQEQKTIHYLHRYAISFQVNLTNAILENALYLVSCNRVQIGKKTLSTGIQRYFNALNFGLKSKKQLKKFIKGLRVRLDGHQEDLSSTLNTQWQQYEKSLSFYQYYQQEGNANGVLTCIVPLVLLAPEIQEFDDAGAVYLDNGNNCVFQIDFNLANQALIASGGVPTYSVTNLQLVRCFSGSLDDGTIARIASANIIYRGIRGYNFSQTPLQSSTSITANIPNGSRPLEIIYGAFPQDGYISTDTAVGVSGANTENIVTRRAGTWSRLKYGLGYSPGLPIRQQTLNVGSQTRTIQNTLIQNYHLAGFVNDCNSPYDEGMQSQLKRYYAIDLKRFDDDMFGPYLDPAVVSFQVDLQTGISTISGQWSDQGGANNLGWSDGVSANGYAVFQDLTLRGYVVLEETFEMNRLQWKV